MTSAIALSAAGSPDAEALLAQRRVAARARAALAEDRWRRYREAAARRAGLRDRSGLEHRFDRLLARGKWPGRALQVARSGLWRARLSQALGYGGGRVVSLTRYVRAGPDPAARPKALFDQAWYLQANPELARSKWPPLAHYLVVGDARGGSPHPLVDVRDYRARHAVKVAASRLSVLQHFETSGALEGFDPHPLFDLRYYVGQCEELAETGENPLVHYLRKGWREGLDPHPLFAGDWYLERWRDSIPPDTAPLLHYVAAGADEGRDPHPLFDAAWYVARRDLGGSGVNPLAHYIRSGGAERRSPTPHFDAAYYLEQNPDLAESRANPLVHYLTEGAYAGSWPAADFDEAAYLALHPELTMGRRSGLEHWVRTGETRPVRAADPTGRWVSAETLFDQLRAGGRVRDAAAYNVAAFQDLSAELSRAAQADVGTGADPAASPRDAQRLLERRDAGIGRLDDVRVIAHLSGDLGPDGWRDVVRALPNYRGHGQPHLPADLGFNDPAAADTLARQAALGRRYGLHGFCAPFSLARPPTELTAAPLALAFCLRLAGEDVDPAALAIGLAPYLAHTAYVRVDGRPLLLAPPPSDARAWTEALRGRLQAEGTGDPYLVLHPPVGQAGDGAGFDALAAWPPFAEAPAAPPPGPVLNRRHQGAVRDYRELARRACAGYAPEQLPLVVPGFDDTPRAQDEAEVFHNASPGAFQAWLEAAMAHVRRTRFGDERLVFVHAWNDWTRGAHLEPDVRFGHGWLEAVRNAADADLLERP